MFYRKHEKFLNANNNNNNNNSNVIFLRTVMSQHASGP